MKKLRIAVLLIILAFSFSVKAEVLFKINCDSDTLYKDKVIKCSGNLLHSEEEINDIEFNYKTDLNINFIELNNFKLTKNNNSVLIHMNNTLFDMIPSNTKILEFTISGSSNLLTFNNIKINNNKVISDVTKSFNIEEENKLDDTCTLDSITISDNKVEGFNKDKTEYNINVLSEIIFIDAVRTSDKSSASGLGGVRVQKGATIIRNVIVTAESGAKKVYKLYINNTSSLDNSESNLEQSNKSDDNSLKNIEIYNGEEKIDFIFDNNSEVFSINNISVDTINIKAELNDSKATFVRGYGPRYVTLKNGYNQILIKTLSESGIEKVITLNITYQEKVNNELESLTINDIVVDLNSDVLEITVPYNIERTMANAIASDITSIINYEDIDLLVGSNKLIIEVVNNGISKIYEVNIIREDNILPDVKENKSEPVITSNNTLNLICYLTFITGLILLTASIIRVIKNKKNTI